MIETDARAAEEEKLAQAKVEAERVESARITPWEAFYLSLS